ncbi:hypothetical protein KDW_57890 [Dictyobacter vulcani]|uniref:Uncharacterized protein n=1 Tax=Dictyobacter vulcani TaxID=2607529 RepID=A0A5J4KYI4_9CHLR|nr:hypothetical protein [Dictyobacter vulcani]GER91627.1 hypothetical protein KDW_57890 [Dictyobacter vulcani]
MAYFQTATSSHAKAAHLYLRLGDSIKVITQAEYLQWAEKSSNVPPCPSVRAFIRERQGRQWRRQLLRQGDKQ